MHELSPVTLKKCSPVWEEKPSIGHTEKDGLWGLKSTMSDSEISTVALA